MLSFESFSPTFTILVLVSTPYCSTTSYILLHFKKQKPYRQSVDTKQSLKQDTLSLRLRNLDILD